MAFSQIRGALRSLVVDTVRRMPDGVVLSVIQGVGLQRKLDYPRADVYLNVSSSEEYFVRLRSCAKEPETVEWIETLGRPGDALYDVGANVGAYSLVAACSQNPVGRVYAFEPSFENYAQLCRNVMLNGKDGQIVPLPIALSDRNGLAEFRFSSVTPGAAAHSLAQGEEGPRRAGDKAQPVMTRRLDDLIAEMGLQPPNLVKIDVDGGEVGVLAGARETLRDPRLRSVLVETGTDTPEQREVFAMLEGAGFVLRSRHTHKATNYIFVRGSEPAA